MMRHKWRSIRSKISLALISTVILSLFVTNITIYIFVSNFYRNQLINNNKEIVNGVANRINAYLCDIEDYSQNVVLDSSVQAFLRTRKSPKEVDYNYYQKISNINDTIKQYAVLKDNIIDDIYVVDQVGEVFSKNPIYNNSVYQSWYSNFIDSGKNQGFTSPHIVLYTKSPGYSEKVISYVTNVYDIKNINFEKSLLGHIVYNIKLDVLTEPLRELDNSTKCFLIDSYGNILYPDSLSNDQIFKYIETAGTEDIVEKRNKEYIFVTKVGNTGWKVIRAIDAHSINMQLIYISTLFVGLFALCIFIFSWVVLILSRKITKPLQLLNYSMKRFSEGDLSTQIEIHSRDEIEEISVVFNQMVESIKTQMEENIKKEEEKRKVQYKYLMAQIKPHFIYNTLNSIIYLARKGRNRDVIVYTKSFIRILQHTIKLKPNEMTTLYEEKMYLDSYILLMQYRYENKIQFDWICNEALLQMEIHVMILYPMVENSIFHGLLPKDGEGKITVKVEKRNNSIKFLIEDNGMGIKKRKLTEIKKSLLHKNTTELYSTEHIGLVNVNDRLRLFYGEKSLLHIESTENVGTKIWFEI